MLYEVITALGQLATDEMTDYLAQFLFTREGDEKVHQAIAKVLVFLNVV